MILAHVYVMVADLSSGIHCSYLFYQRQRITDVINTVNFNINVQFHYSIIFVFPVSVNSKMFDEAYKQDDNEAFYHI